MPDSCSSSASTSSAGTSAAGGREGPVLLRREAVRAVVRLDLMVLPRWYLPVLPLVYLVAVLGWGGWGADQLVHPVVVVSVALVALPCTAVWTAGPAGRMNLLWGVLPLGWTELLRARYLQLLVYQGLLHVMIVGAVSLHLGVGAQAWARVLVLWVLCAPIVMFVPPVLIRYGGQAGLWVLGAAVLAWVSPVIIINTFVRGIIDGRRDAQAGAGDAEQGGVLGEVEPASSHLAELVDLLAHGNALPGLTVLVVVVSAAGLYASWRLSLRLHRRRDL